MPEYISPVVQTMFDYSAAGDFGFHEAGLEVEVAPGVISKPWPLGARIPRKPPPAKNLGYSSAANDFLRIAEPSLPGSS